MSRSHDGRTKNPAQAAVIRAKQATQLESETSPIRPAHEPHPTDTPATSPDRIRSAHGPTPPTNPARTQTGTSPGGQHNLRYQLVAIITDDLGQVIERKESEQPIPTPVPGSTLSAADIGVWWLLAMLTRGTGWLTGSERDLSKRIEEHAGKIVSRSQLRRHVLNLKANRWISIPSPGVYIVHGSGPGPSAEEALARNITGELIWQGSPDPCAFCGRAEDQSVLVFEACWKDISSGDLCFSRSCCSVCLSDRRRRQLSAEAMQAAPTKPEPQKPPKDEPPLAPSAAISGVGESSSRQLSELIEEPSIDPADDTRYLTPQGTRRARKHT
jgi:hypothetical protein